MNLKEEKRKRRIKRKADQKKRIVKRTLKDALYPYKRKVSRHLLFLERLAALREIFYGKTKKQEGTSEGTGQSDVAPGEGEGREMRDMREGGESTERPLVQQDEPRGTLALS